MKKEETFNVVAANDISPTPRYTLMLKPSIAECSPVAHKRLASSSKNSKSN